MKKTITFLTILFSLISASAFPDLQGTPPPAWDTVNALHYTETSGYNHNTRNNSWAMVQSITANNPAGYYFNWTNTQSSQPYFTNLYHVQNGDTILNYDIIFFSNTSGHNLFTQAERDHFEEWYKAGGSYLGCHAASDTYPHDDTNAGGNGKWDFYAENVAGASVRNSPNHTSNNKSGTITHTGVHVTQLGIPDPWPTAEEWYYWHPLNNGQGGYIDPKFTEVLQVGWTGSNSTRDQPRMVYHVWETHWCGRTAYTSLGHNNSDFTGMGNHGAYFQQVILNSLIWLADDPCPSPFGIWDELFGESPVTVEQAQIEEGFIYLDIPEGELPRNPFYKVYTLQGREVMTGMILEGRIPLIVAEEPLLYKTYNQVFKVMSYDF